jgi:hypothetical protein
VCARFWRHQLVDRIKQSIVVRDSRKNINLEYARCYKYIEFIFIISVRTAARVCDNPSSGSIYSIAYTSALNMEAVYSSESLAPTYSTQSRNREDHNMNFHCDGSHKYYIFKRFKFMLINNLRYFVLGILNERFLRIHMAYHQHKNAISLFL